MSRMLSLFSAGVERAGRLAKAGQLANAHSTLDTALPSATDSAEAARGHAAAAEVAVRAERFKLARRHLREAVRLRPTAAWHFALAQAFENDPFGCDRRAAKHYKKAHQLDASTPKYKAALGRAMVRIGETKSGVNVLCRAVTAAPVDREVLQIAVEGLAEAGHSDRAFRLLSQARFLAPHDTAIRQLWQQTRYDLAAEGQRAGRLAAARQPAVIPFLKVFESEPAGEPKTRRDVGSHPAAHVGRLRTYRADNR